MRIRVLAAVAVLGLGWAGAASAHSVDSPYVEKGVLEVETSAERLNGGPGDGDSALKLELGYGVTDRLHIAAFSEMEDEPGQRARADSVGLEAVAYFGQIPGTGVDVGGYFEFEQRLHNESAALEAKLLLARKFGPVEGLFNLVAEQALTDKDGEGAMEFGYAAQAVIPATDDFKLGVQAVGELGTNRDFGGRRAHWAGPVAEWELEHLPLPGELEFQASYLLPVGDAARDEADGQFRFVMEFERAF